MIVDGVDYFRPTSRRGCARRQCSLLLGALFVQVHARLLHSVPHQGRTEISSLIVAPDDLGLYRSRAQSGGRRDGETHSHAGEERLQFFSAGVDVPLPAKLPAVDLDNPVALLLLPHDY